jgi:hypothetical protein
VAAANKKVFYPPIRNQPFTSKSAPTAYADGARLTGQADDYLVPCGNRFGCISADNSDFPISEAGEQRVAGKSNSCCRVTLSLLGLAALLAIAGTVLKWDSLHNAPQ